MEALRGEAQVARAAHELAAAIGDHLVARSVGAGADGQRLQRPVGHSTALAGRAPQRIKHPRHAFEEPEVTHQANRRALDQLVMRIRGHGDGLRQRRERHAVHRIQSQRSEVIEKRTPLFERQSGNGQQVSPGRPVLGRHDIGGDFAQTRVHVDHVVELEKELSMCPGFDMRGPEPLEHFRERGRPREHVELEQKDVRAVHPCPFDGGS